MKIDIVVAGGGSAGLAAAVTAARSGARVVLVERNGMLGGMATLAHVHSLCGLYQLRDSEGESLLYSNQGFPVEFTDRLFRNGGARGPVRMGRLDVVLHRPSTFARVADEFVSELPNLEVMLHSEILEVKSDGEGKIRFLNVHSRGTRYTLESDAVIDTSGDAEIAKFAGAVWQQTEEEKLQRPAYIFGMAGVDPASITENGRMALARAISYGVSGGELPKAALGVAFRAGVSAQEVWGTIDLEANGFQPTDSQKISLLERQGRELASVIMNFLAREVEGFKSAVISAFPARLGIRESRRISGIHELTEEDILAGARFPDEVAVSSWPIELREKAHGPKFRFPEGNRSCGIRWGCLRSRNVSNLFVAGRCISSTHEAQAAVRVIGTCLATGQAAGKAAVESLASPANHVFKQ